MEIYEKHTELFHYTNFAGLKGILQTQSLWATHYRYLNDASELQLMRSELAERLYPFIREKVQHVFVNASFSKKNEMRAAGGVPTIAKSEAERFTEAFYATAFEEEGNRGGIAVPYITSFCSHSDDHPYEQRNGLLSQWRAYGEEDGFALVFNTKKLIQQYKKDWEFYDTAAGSCLGDVVYQGDEEAFKENFQETTDRLITMYGQLVSGEEWDVGQCFPETIMMFARLKHQAFREEREVRALAFPMTDQIFKKHKEVNPDFEASGKPVKNVEKRSDGTPYIVTLNDEVGRPLPINRIIVGPQAKQNQMAEEIREIVGSNIEIHRSETPLVKN